MENNYRIERTRKTVRAIGPDGHDTMGSAKVTIVWDDNEGIGLECPPYGDIVGNPEKGIKFDTEDKRNHARQVARAIQKYIEQNNIN